MSTHDPRIPKLQISTPPISEEDLLDNDAARDSLDTLNSQIQNSTIHEDTDDQSLNTDLASVAISNSLQTPSFNNDIQNNRTSFDSSSIFTSSFRQSFDDFGSGGLPLLGNNQVSIQSYSPLGANSIYELVADVDAKQRRASSLKAGSSKKPNSLTGGGVNIMKPTQLDIQPVVIPKIEKADKEILRRYLNEVEGEFEKFDSNKKLTSSSLKKIDEVDQDGNGTVDSLESVPKIYFQKEFNLDDPRVFKQVLEGFKLSQLNLQHQQTEDGSLQEKLSTYLDTVEVHLVAEISKSSASFFDALNDLTEIQSKNTTAMSSIDTLNESLHKLSNSKIRTGLKKCQLLKKKENVGKLEQVILQISTVKQGLVTAQEKFYQSEYKLCLEQLEEVQQLILGTSNTLNWPYPLTNLNLLPAIQPVHRDIKSLKLKVGESYTKLFIDYLVNDLRSHYEDLPHGTLFKDLVEGKITSASSATTQEFKDGLSGYLEGLIRCEVIPEALIQYQNQVLTEMKNIVRVYLPNEENIEKIKINSGSASSVSAATTSKTNSASLGQLIKSLTPKEFEYVLVQIIVTTLAGFNRLKTHQKLLLDLTLNSKKTTVSNELIASLDINPAISKSIEIVQLRIGKVLKVRTDLNSMLRYDYFLRLFFINTTFINLCESVAGLQFKELPYVLNELVKGFNGTTFGNYKGKCVRSVDLEKWSPVIVDFEMQEMMNKITEKQKLDPQMKWKQDLLEYIVTTGEQATDDTASSDLPSTEPNSASTNDETQTDTEPVQKSNKRSLVVGDKMYVASSTLLTYLSILHETLLISSNLPRHLMPNYEQFTLDLTRTFIARITQSITLKDGKLNSENINLSVVGETLDCVMEVLLYIRLWFDNQRFGEEYERVIGIVKSLKAKIDNASLMRMQDH
ncbi:hypothetical protein WICPIJ_005948 [Wickerhamomyces pijperi]|uniref:Vacuolar protein sorting-associated protein 54 n=1 Tax=Wickerhamomyces pijperi TaxID=599730 RepID=A0A9P8TLG9_WICPI|nr:hypothetical protein WICPIJ_005948 [Wickerhamomyces pijperi]